MKLWICGVRDNARGSFNPPFVAASVREAARNFHGIFRSKEAEAAQNHPEDFDLYTFGHFMPETGEFQTGVPRLVARGVNQQEQHVQIEDEWGGM